MINALMMIHHIFNILKNSKSSKSSKISHTFKNSQIPQIPQEATLMTWYEFMHKAIPVFEEVMASVSDVAEDASQTLDDNIKSEWPTSVDTSDHEQVARLLRAFHAFIQEAAAYTSAALAHCDENGMEDIYEGIDIEEWNISLEKSASSLGRAIEVMNKTRHINANVVLWIAEEHDKIKRMYIGHC
jgi:hypothetical protein